MSASRPGARVGVAWLAHADGICPYCRGGRENLCDAPMFTGYTRDGGYATHTIADADFVYPLPEDLDPVETAPLLCAGLIGWRSLKLAGDGRTIGFYGFGAAGHIIAQVCRWQGRRVFAFTRPGDVAGQAFARSMGAEWAGGSDEQPPEPLDAAILFAPAGELVPAALAALRKGGRVVCGGIHMSDIPAFPYALVGGAQRRLGRQPDPRRRPRISGARAGGEGADDDHALSARQGQRGSRRLAQRQARRRGGARALRPRPKGSRRHALRPLLMSI